MLLEFGLGMVYPHLHAHRGRPLEGGAAGTEKPGDSCSVFMLDLSVAALSGVKGPWAPGSVL